MLVCVDVHSEQVAAGLQSVGISPSSLCPAFLYSTTCCLDSPNPSIPTSTMSPGFRYFGGFIPSPTPAGVPVLITSPGRSVMNSLTYDIGVGTSKIMFEVELFCRYSPLTL